jgi:predicted aspartyl protease
MQGVTAIEWSPKPSSLHSKDLFSETHELHSSHPRLRRHAAPTDGPIRLGSLIIPVRTEYSSSRGRPARPGPPGPSTRLYDAAARLQVSFSTARTSRRRRRDSDRLDKGNVRSPEIYEEPTISGHLNGADVSVFPDTGAAANFISLPYAQRRGLAVDENLRAHVKVGNGWPIPIIGTTRLQFAFAGEPEIHSLTFHVLRQSVHDIILGSAFLHASETFTRFAHRVGSKIRDVSHGIRRISFLGSQQYVNGLANGVGVDALPDTGADVCVMSASFAMENGFDIDDDKQHRISLQFADGSKARAGGVVKNVAWRFGADEQTHPTDVYVLSKLPVDLVLGYGFLRHTEAFSEHGRDFWHVQDIELEEAWMLCVIRVMKRAMKGAGVECPCEYRLGVI